MSQWTKLLKESPYPAQREQAAHTLATHDWRANPQVLTALMDSNRTPLATPIVFERIGDLSGDREADDLRFAELKTRKPFPEAGEVSAEVQAHIVRDFGPGAAEVGGDQLLMSSLARSLSAGAMAAQK